MQRLGDLFWNLHRAKTVSSIANNTLQRIRGVSLKQKKLKSWSLMEPAVETCWLCAVTWASCCFPEGSLMIWLNWALRWWGTCFASVYRVFTRFQGPWGHVYHVFFGRLWTFKGLSILFMLVIQLSFVALQLPTERTTIEMHQFRCARGRQLPSGGEPAGYSATTKELWWAGGSACLVFDTTVLCVQAPSSLWSHQSQCILGKTSCRCSLRPPWGNCSQRARLFLRLWVNSILIPD